MDRREIINKTKEYVRGRLGKEATGHDWWHAFRVWKTAKYIAKKEGGDLFIIELGRNIAFSLTKLISNLHNNIWVLKNGLLKKWFAQTRVACVVFYL